MSDLDIFTPSITYFGFSLPRSNATDNNSAVSSALRYPLKLFPFVSNPINILFKLSSPGVPWCPSLSLTGGWFAQRITRRSPSLSSDVLFKSRIGSCQNTILSLLSSATRELKHWRRRRHGRRPAKNGL